VLSLMGSSGGLVNSIDCGQTVMGTRDETLWKKILMGCLDPSSKTLSEDKREPAGSRALVGNRGSAIGRVVCKWWPKMRKMRKKVKTRGMGL